MSLDLWGRYLFTTSGSIYWAGVGFNLLFPSSSESNAVQEDSINSTNVIAFGGGADIALSPTSYIPIQVEYGMYPSSVDVTASAVSIRLGYAFNW